VRLSTFHEWIAPSTDGHLIFSRVVFCIMDSSVFHYVPSKKNGNCVNVFWILFRDKFSFPQANLGISRLNYSRHMSDYVKLKVSRYCPFEVHSWNITRREIVSQIDIDNIADVLLLKDYWKTFEQLAIFWIANLTEYGSPKYPSSSLSSSVSDRFLYQTAAFGKEERGAINRLSMASRLPVFYFR